MAIQKIIKTSSKVFVGLSILSVGYVSVLSLVDPVATMALVNTPLPNTDAISSIRGIYGGVGLAITLSLVYLLLRDFKLGLAFLSLFWGGYAISRIITLSVEGPLGDFGSQWLMIESVFFVLSSALLWLTHRYQADVPGGGFSRMASVSPHGA